MESPTTPTSESPPRAQLIWTLIVAATVAYIVLQQVTRTPPARMGSASPFANKIKFLELTRI